MAAKQDSVAELLAIVKKFIQILGFLTFPLMALLVILAKPLIILLYTDKWIECIPYFQILCVAGIAVCLQTINYNAIAAIGKSKSLFRWTILKRAIGICLIIAGSFFGIYGILIGTVLASWVIYICNAYLVEKFLHYTLISQIKDLLPIFACTSLSMLAAYIPLLFSSPNISIYCMQTIIFCGIYLISSMMIKSMALSDIKKILMKKI